MLITIFVSFEGKQIMHLLKGGKKGIGKFECNSTENLTSFSPPWENLESSHRCVDM